MQSFVHKCTGLCGLAVGLSILASGATATPLSYTFNTRVEQVFDLDSLALDPASPFVGTTGIATLLFDDSDLELSFGGFPFFASFEYLATSSASDSSPSFTLTHDFGSGAQIFYGEDDLFEGGARFYFGDDPEYPVLGVNYDVADDNLFTFAFDDIISEAGIVDFSAIDFDRSTQTILFEVQAGADLPPIPLPASGLVLLTALGAVAVIRQRRRI